MKHVILYSIDLQRTAVSRCVREVNSPTRELYEAKRVRREQREIVKYESKPTPAFNPDIRSTQLRKQEAERRRLLQAEIDRKFGPVNAELRKKFTPMANW